MVGQRVLVPSVGVRILLSQYIAPGAKNRLGLCIGMSAVRSAKSRREFA